MGVTETMKKKLWMTLLLVIVLCATIVFCVGCFGGNKNNTSDIGIDIDQSGNQGGSQGGNQGGSQGGSDYSDTATYTVRIHYTDSKVREISTGEQMENFTATRDGYDFLGLFDSAVGGSMFVQANGTAVQLITKNTELYCQWAPKDVTINLSTPVGRIDGKTSYIVKAGEAFPDFGAPLYNQNQYSFAGWEYNGDLVSDGSRFFSGYGGAYDNYDLSDLTIDLIASFDLAKLKVVFDYNDGSYEQTVYETSYGAEFDFEYPEPTGIDREVLFWSDTPSGKDPYVPDKITGNLTLYAIWDDIKTVKFYTTKEIYTEAKYYRSRDVVVADATRDGYEFDGWYNSESYFGNPITSFTFGSLLKAYYAKWTPITYHVHLNDEQGLDNEFQSDYTYTVESDLDFPADLTKKGYRFVGFADEEGNVFTKPGVDTIGLEELTASYVPVDYVITYYNEDDRTKLTEVTVHYLDEMPVVTSRRVGYNIDRFFLENGSEYVSDTYDYDADLTLYVRYVAIQYEIHYHLNGGENNVANPATYTIEQSVTLQDPSKEYSIFEGWFVDGGYTEEFPGIAVGSHQEVDVYAYFRGLNYRVNLDANGGECQREYVTIPYDEQFTLPICTRADHTFIGWYTTAEGEGVQLTDETGTSLAVSTFHETTTAYARYNARYYVSISSNCPEAFTLTPDEFYYEGAEVKLALRWDDGYDFLGFFPNAEAEEALTHSQVYIFNMPAENVSLYIKFSPKLFYVYLNANGGEIDKEFVVVDYGKNYELPVPVFGGKDFVGWVYNDEYLTYEDGASLAPYNVKNDIHVEAVFMDISGATILYKVEDFDAIRNANTGYYVMATNMSLKGRDYVPFEFKGTLDGRGYTLQTDKTLFTNVTGTVKDLIVDADIYVENPTTTEAVNAAILSITINGTIDNVTTRGSVHLKGRGSVGGFCYQLASGKIINSTNEATVYGELDMMERECGGVVAYRSGGEIKDTVNKGAVTGYYRVGGVIGLANSWSNIKNVSNLGTVTGHERVGGVVGSLEYSGSSPTIETLTNAGEVHGDNRVGGVFGNIGADWYIGYNDGRYNLTLVELVNSGKIVGKTYVSGVVGYYYTRCRHDGSHTSYVALSVKNFTNTGDVEGNTYVGGLFGYAYTDTGSAISASRSSGHIHAVNGLIGGLAGQLQNISINDCSNEGTVLTLDTYILDGSNTNAFLGGYVGYGHYVSGCDNATAITYTEKGRWVGGIAGYLTSGITNCNNTAAITAEKSVFVGGLVGEFSYSWGSPSIQTSSNSGDISGTERVGGLIGSLYASWGVGYNDGRYTLTIDRSVNSGKITATANYAGGMVGYLFTQCLHDGSHTSYVVLYATNLENTGDVSGNAYVGGLFGYGYTNNGGSSIATSSSSATISAVEYVVGGIAGQLSSIGVSNCSNEGSTITLEKMHLNGSDFDAYLGGYVGYGYSVSGCDNAVDITYIGTGRWVGGIVGYVTSALTDCHNSGDIIATKSTYVGGLVGEFNYAWGSPSIKTSTNSGAVTGASNVGGLFGRIYASWGVGYNDGKYSLTMDQLENSGTVTASGTYVGSMVGYVRVNCNHDGSHTSYVFMQCTTLVNSGDVVGGSADNIGTMFGYVYTNHGGSFANMCTNTGTATGNGSVIDKAVGSASNFTLTFAEE